MHSRFPEKMRLWVCVWRAGDNFKSCCIVLWHLGVLWVRKTVRRNLKVDQR